MKQGFFLAWLASLSLLGFLSSDMYLPAFAQMQIDLGTSEMFIGWTLSAYLLGLAFAQLVYGPLSDTFGRKPVLQAGLAIYIVASIGAAMAPSVWVLLGLRLLQAVGVCAAAVIWQAITVDHWHDQDARERVFRLIMPLVALSPALAPVVGSYVAELAGWREIFLVIAGTGVITMLGSFMVKESLATEQRQPTLQMGRLLSDFRSLLAERRYLGNVIVYAAGSGAFFAYLTASPFVMEWMGYSPAQIGISFIPQTIAFMLGGYLGGVLGRWLNKRQQIQLLLVFWIIAAGAMVIASQTEITTIWPLLVPFCLLAFANGAIYPMVVNEALGVRADLAATAAGLQGFLQTMACFVTSGLVAAMLGQFGSIGLTLLIFAMGGLMILGRWWAQSEVAPANGDEGGATAAVGVEG